MKRILLPIFSLLLSHGLFAQTYFSEDFDDKDLVGWSNTDDDTDVAPSSGTNYDLWYASDFSSYYTECGPGSAISRSWANVSGSGKIYTPNNFLTSSVIDLSGASSSGLTLSFTAGNIEPTYFAEHYAVYLTTSSNMSDITSATPVYETTISVGEVNQVVTVDVSAFAGQQVYLTFRHFNCSDENALIIDNIFIKKQLDLDAAITATSLNRYSLVSVDNTLSMTVKNEGITAINSITAEWNDGVPHSVNQTVTIAPGATATVTFPDKVRMDVPGEKGLNITITQVNGGSDMNMANNSAVKFINVMDQLYPRSVLFEEGTGTWCGWCPRGAVAMDYMAAKYPDNFIGVAVHNGDPMTVTEYDDRANFSGYPSSNVDRAILDASVGTSAWETAYNQRKDLVVPATLDAELTFSGNVLQARAIATFHTEFIYSQPNFRLGIILVEDDVTGTSSGYAQTNYYAGGSNGAMGGYESLPDPVPAAQMVYNHVGRALLGGYDGQANSVPTTIYMNQDVWHDFTYNMPTLMDRTQTHAVVVLIDNATGEIVNSKSFSMSTASVSEKTLELGMEVFPNPAKDQLTLAFDAKNGDYLVTIHDLQGRTVFQQTYNQLAGMQNINVPLAELNAGNYLISLSTNGATSTTHFQVSK